MLTNFITDVDLKKYYPKLSSYLWTNQADYSTQINEAFEITLDELRARGVEPRRLHLPIDLNRDFDSVVKQDQSISIVQSSNGYSNKYAIGMSGFRRFMVNVSAKSGTTPGLAMTLQGSNDLLLQTTQMPTNWNPVTSLSFSDVGTKTIVFTNEYKYYRIAWTITGTSPSFTFTAGLVETYVDRWIVHKAFQLIFNDFSKDPADIWADRSRSAQQVYDSAMESSKFVLDNDNDNVPDPDESEEGAEVRFLR